MSRNKKIEPEKKLTRHREKEVRVKREKEIVAEEGLAA